MKTNIEILELNEENELVKKQENRNSILICKYCRMDTANEDNMLNKKILDS